MGLSKGENVIGTAKDLAGGVQGCRRDPTK